MKFLKKKCSWVRGSEFFDPTQPNPRESEKSRPNPTHGSTQPMNNSDCPRAEKKLSEQ